MSKTIKMSQLKKGDLINYILKLKVALEYYANSTIGEEIEPGKYRFPIGV